MQAGAELKLLRLTYDGVRRDVEPYSLVFKRRKDGYGQEYFYVYDRTGGHQNPGIKALLNPKIRDLEIVDETLLPISSRAFKSRRASGRRLFRATVPWWPSARENRMDIHNSVQLLQPNLQAPRSKHCFERTQR